MPVMPCREDDKPGYKFGQSGKCYTYTPGNKASRERARKKAAKQGAAQHANKLRKALDDILAKF